MPEITWNVDDARVTLKDFGRLGVTVVVPGHAERPIPPMALGQWPIPFPGRQVELRAIRNLDVVRFQLWSDGHLVPRGSTRTRSPAPANAVCRTHTDRPASSTCGRCGGFVCQACAPDGIHCGSCLVLMQREEAAAITRSRRIGVIGGLALGATLTAVGVVTASPRVLRVGVGSLVLVAFLVARSWWQERTAGK
jgi:hypothetical protein